MIARLALLVCVLLGLGFGTSFAQTASDEEAAERAAEVLTGLEREAPLPVFGNQLFIGASESSRASTDPSYVLQRGDRIAVRSFGAYNADIVEEIDQNGMLFVPQVGPISLAGKRAGQLQPTIETQVRETFTENVRVYASLLTPGSIGVYVSGDVNRPGRYLGSSTDDVLYYLQSAGGINTRRGTFRDVQVIRNNDLHARVDLYDFLLRGRSPDVDFRDGDVIFVPPRGPLIGAEGEVLAPYAYELREGPALGAQLTALARPMAEATHVALSGTRAGVPFIDYIALSAFEDVLILDGDRVEYRSDVFGQTIAVAVQSTASNVQALYVLPRDAHLTDLLALTRFDPSRIDFDAIHVNRPSVARQQKEALNESLDRLERAAAFGGVATVEAAQVRRAEAEIIQSFVQRARQAEPSGTITVMEDGSLQDLTLEDGDVVVVPDQTDVVLVAGEVVAPGAFVAVERESIRDYIRRAGGFQSGAHRGRFVVRKRSGAALEVGARYRPEAGDQILVLPKPSNRGLLLASEVTQVIFQLALSTATVARL